MEPEQPQNIVQELVQELRQRPAAQQRLKPPTFDGSTDIRNFINLFDQVRNQNQWTPEHSAIQLKLAVKHPASEGLLGETYEELCNCLMNRYEVTEEEARRQLRQARLGKNENIYGFGDRIQKLVRIAYPDLDDDQKEHHAVNTIVDSIEDWTLRREFRLQPPANFLDAVQRITEYNSDRKSVGKIRRVELGEENSETKIDKLERQCAELSTKMGSLEKQVSSIEDKVGKTMEKGLNSFKDLLEQHNTANVRASGPFKPVVCFYCKKAGHRIAECRKKKFDGQKSQNLPKSEN